MAFMTKITITRYIGSNGMRCRKNTEGAKKVSEISSHWYLIDRSKGHRPVRIKLSRDRATSQKIFQKKLAQIDLERAGLVDRTVENLSQDFLPLINEHLEITRPTNTPFVTHERKRILIRFAHLAAIRTVADFNVTAIEKYLATHPQTAGTRKKHYSTLNKMGKWLRRASIITENPLEKIDPPRGTQKNRYRSLTKDELTKLMQAAFDRPLHEKMKVNRGANKGRLCAHISEETKAEAIRKGEERAFLYYVAAGTCLRRNELNHIRVKNLFVEEESKAYLTLPASAVKNRKETRIPLFPDLAKAFKNWVLARSLREEDRIFCIPLDINKDFQLDLRFAGIKKENSFGHVAVFHSLRSTGNRIMREANVSAKQRQLFMRHSDIRLTLQTYDDSPSTIEDLREATSSFQTSGITLPKFKN